MILYHLSDQYLGTNPTLPNESSGHGVALGHTALTAAGMFLYADYRSMIESIPLYEYEYFKENNERPYWIYSLEIDDNAIGTPYMHMLDSKMSPEVAINASGKYYLVKKYFLTLVERIPGTKLARYKFEWEGYEGPSRDDVAKNYPFYGDEDSFYFISISPEASGSTEIEPAEEVEEPKEIINDTPNSSNKSEYSGSILAALGVLGAVD